MELVEPRDLAYFDLLRERQLLRRQPLREAITAYWDQHGATDPITVAPSTREAFAQAVIGSDNLTMTQKHSFAKACIHRLNLAKQTQNDLPGILSLVLQPPSEGPRNDEKAVPPVPKSPPPVALEMDASEPPAQTLSPTSDTLTEEDDPPNVAGLRRLVDFHTSFVAQTYSRQLRHLLQQLHQSARLTTAERGLVTAYHGAFQARQQTESAFQLYRQTQRHQQPAVHHLAALVQLMAQWQQTPQARSFCLVRDH